MFFFLWPDPFFLLITERSGAVTGHLRLHSPQHGGHLERPGVWRVSGKSRVPKTLLPVRIPLDSLWWFGILGYLVTVSHFWLFMVLWRSWGLVLSGPFDRRKPQLGWFVTKLLNRNLSPGADSELCSRGSRRPWLWSGACRGGCWAPGIFGSLRCLCNSQLCPVTEGAGVLGSVWFSVAVPLSSRTKLGVCCTEAAIVFRTIPPNQVHPAGILGPS